MMTVEEMESICSVQSEPAFLRDPLEIPELALSGTFYPMGFPLEVRTNADEVLELVRLAWSESSQRYDVMPMLCEVYVAEGGPEECPPSPSYRFHAPILSSIADAQHYTLIDMEQKKTYISITRGSLQHPLYLQYFYLMMPLCTLPVRAFHAACVARNGRGILLCGDPGAGKSTLSYACARAGWDYISDDACLLLDGPQRRVAGNCNLVRFRPSAAEFFPEVRGLDLTPRASGKPSIELSTLPMANLKRCFETNIDFIVFLNRKHSGSAQLLPYSKDVARLYLQQGIYGSIAEKNSHADDVEKMLRVDVLELRYNSLEWAIQRLEALVDDGK